MTFPRITEKVCIPPLAADIAERCSRKRIREAAADQRASLLEEMTADIAAQLAVLNQAHGGGYSIAAKDLLDRARNVTAAILGNFKVERWP